MNPLSSSQSLGDSSSGASVGSDQRGGDQGDRGQRGAESSVTDRGEVSELVERLVDRWEQSRFNGHEMTPEELCGEHPELLDEVREQIAALKWVPAADVLAEVDSGDGTRIGGSTGGPFAADTLLADRYRLIEPVGEGGFGTVWRGIDTELQRTVAIKIPRGRRAPVLANDRFLAEARRLAKLRHPGIVPVFDVGRHAGVVFIVSDFIDGHTLAEELATGEGQTDEAVPLSRVVAVITRVAEALHAAHTEGFIHRDVKPSNILIDHDGQAFLADFGVAVESNSSLTQTGLSGTLSYMAPEQARGKGESVDARTDAFALGVVLYEMLTGRRPFVSDSPAELRRQIIDAQPVTPRELKRRISPELSAVCLRALARDPTDRFTSTIDMAKAVRQSVDAARRRKRTMVATAGTVVLAGVVTALLATAPGWWSSGASDPDASTDPDASPVAATRTAPGANIDPVRSDGPAATTFSELGDSSSSASDRTPVSSTETITESQVFRGHSRAVSSLAISSDGRRVLSGSWDKTLRLWHAETGQLIREFQGHTEGIGGVALSPDGRTAASGAGHLYRDATLRLWDVETGDELARFKGHEHNIMAVAWAPNGEFLITGSLDNTIRRWQSPRDLETNTGTDPETDSESAAGSNAATLLGTVRRPDVNNWAGQVWAVAISPDSRQVLAGLRDYTARLIDADSGRQLRSLAGHTDQVRSVAFSADGTRVLTASLDGTARLWSLATGETIYEYDPGVGALNTAIFGPDESTLLSGGQHDTFVMLDIRTGRVLARFEGHTEQIMALHQTPDGNILSASHDATIRKWPMRTAATLMK